MFPESFSLFYDHIVMKKKIIHEQQTVDLETGEIKTVTTSSLRGNDQTFVMGRTTAGYEWLKNLTALELKLLMIMVDNKSRKDNTIPLTDGKIGDISVSLDFSIKTVKNSLRALRQKRLIKEISKGVYLVDPLTFYTGGTNNWKRMYDEYVSVNDRKYA
jgi:DNA primase